VPQWRRRSIFHHVSGEKLLTGGSENS